MNNGDLPAFPVFDKNGQVWEIKDFVHVPSTFGLTRREYFAAKAMQSMLANSNLYYSPLTKESLSNVISDSFILADAMIKESEK